MASIELGLLSQHLDDEEIERVVALLEDADVPAPTGDESDGVVVSGDLDDDLFVDFLDRLEANDAACDIYLPSEFEDAISGAGYTVGSAHALLLVLDELRDEFFESDDEDEDETGGLHDDEAGDYEFDDEDDEFGGLNEAGPIDLKDEHLRQTWKLMYRGARECIKTKLCLFVIR